MKTVLLIAYYYPPLGGIGSQRALKWARFLADFGWKVIVLTPESGAYHLDTTLDDGTESGVEVVRTPVWSVRLRGKSAPNPSTLPKSAPPNVPGSGAQNPLKARLKTWVRTWLYIPDGQNGWYFPAVRAGDGLFEKHQIDAIVSTSFPVTAHLIAARLKRRHGVPWVADFRDLWTENQSADFYASPVRKRLDQRIERRLLRRCDALTTVSSALAHTLRSIARKKRVEVIRNGFDPADFAGLQGSAPDKWTLTFVGTYYPFYDPAPLLRVLSRLLQSGQMERNTVRFRAVGAPHPELQRLLQEANLSDIAEFTGFVSHQAALQFTVDASLLLLLMPRDRKQSGVVTGKIFEYLGARRPILALSPPEFEAAQIVRESGAGEVISPGDEAAIEAFLLRSYAAFCAGRSDETAPKNLESYERRAGAKQLAALLDDLT